MQPKSVLWHVPKAPSANDIQHEVSIRDERGFEKLVCDLFNRIPNWKAHWTGGSADQGADLLVTSSTGKTYAIQCKKRTATNNEGNEAVQQVVASLSYYGVSTGIVLTTAPGYTESAKALATANRVILWTLADLAVIAKAEFLQDESELKATGLEYAILMPPNKKQSLSTRWVKWTAMALTGMLALFVAPEILKSTTSLNSQNAASNESLRQFIEVYDVKYQDILQLNNLDDVEDILVSPQADEVKNNISLRLAKKCYRETVTIEPMQILEAIVLNENSATARVRKHWIQSEVCPDKTTQVVTNPFVATYTMVYQNGWKVAKTAVSPDK